MKQLWIIILIGIIFGMIACGDSSNEPDVTYSVTFDADGGTPAPQSQTVKAGEKVAAPANPAKQGYVFLFWHLSGANTAYNFQTPVNSDIALQAKWENEAAAEYWQVAWELNGGAWSAEDNHANQVIKGGTLAEPIAPIKAGSAFEGWYKEAALNYKVTFPYDVSNVTDNFILYSKWIGNSQADGISLNKTSLELYTTDRERLVATITPVGTLTASWSSSDKQVAIVDDKGVIKATGEGKAIITASVGNKSASCNIKVSPSIIVGGYDGYNEVLWKNGEELKFTNYNTPKSINSVFVYEGDIYITGTKTEIYSGVSNNQAVVIKIQSAIPGDPNGVNTTDQLLELKGKKSFGEDIFISNGDIYVVGSEKATNSFNQEYSRAAIWKNGKLQVLSTSDASVDANSRSVYVAGDDVYIAGNGGYYVDDGVWKNGQFQTLNRPSESIRIKAYSVFVSGDDVYVAGTAYYKDKPIDTTKPVLWKNGVPTILDERSILYSVFVSGNDIYAAGTGSVSPIWKNGISMSFDENPLIRSVYVYNNDVYAVSNDALWKNGKKQSWGSGNSVFVK